MPKRLPPLLDMSLYCASFSRKSSPSFYPPCVTNILNSESRAPWSKLMAGNGQAVEVTLEAGYSKSPQGVLGHYGSMVYWGSCRIP